jgi:hypothetical protein
MSDDQIIEGTKVTASMANTVDYGNLGRFYANHVQVNVSLFEIRLIMNFVMGINPASQHLQALDTMYISMSPELAAATYALLGQAIENYKKDYGSLRSPEAKIKITQNLTEEQRRALDMQDLPYQEEPSPQE